MEVVGEGINSVEIEKKGELRWPGVCPQELVVERRRTGR